MKKNKNFFSREKIKELLNNNMSSQNSEIIELVYNHPFFKKINKEDLKLLYEKFGIDLFNEFYPTAHRLKEFNKK